MFARKATARVLAVLGVVAWALVGASDALAWAWPADGPVLREFSVGSDPYAAGQHRGIDVGIEDGRVVRAPAAGELTFAGSVPTHGLTVTIVTGDGHKVSLTHLGTLLVKRGASVGEGDPIAEPGPSGTAEHDVPYVHLGIRVGEGDTYVDPLSLLPPRVAPNPPPAPAAPPAPAPTPATPPPAPAPPTVSPPPAPAAEPAPASPPPPAAAPDPAHAPALQPAADAAGDAEVAEPAIGVGGTFEMSRKTAREAGRARDRVSTVVLQSKHVGTSASRVGEATVHGFVPKSSGDPLRPAPSSTARPHDRARPTATRTLDTTTAVREPRSGRPVAAPAPAEGRARSGVLERASVAALLAGLLAAVALLGGFGARRVARKRLPIIDGRESDGIAQEDPCRGGLAVRKWTAPHRSCGGVRRAFGHVRALPPAPRERRPHGEWDGRARNAGHGRSRRRGRVPA